MEFNLTLPEIALLCLSCYIGFLLMRYHKQIRRWFNNPGPRCAVGICWLFKRPHTEVVPWHEVKHTAGRKKHSQTEGFYCTNTLCDYFGVTDAVCSCSSQRWPPQWHPLLEMPGLRSALQQSPRYAHVPHQDTGRTGLFRDDRSFGRRRPRRRFAHLRPPPLNHCSLACARRQARRTPARPAFLPPPAPGSCPAR